MSTLKTYKQLRVVLYDALLTLRTKSEMSRHEIDMLQHAERLHDSLKHVIREKQEGTQEL